MKLNIILSYDKADKLIPLWANMERKIDFLTQPEEAKKCTLSFAATEIADHIKLFFPDVEISFASKEKNNAKNIKLSAESAGKDCSFVINPLENGIEIIGKGRTGALYGAYEFLRTQGIRWITPEDKPQRVTQTDTLCFPKERKTYVPSMPLGRGFCTSAFLKESEKLWVWMARNMLNMFSYCLNSGALQEKLGMTFVMGGHILTQMLSPDRVLKSGKTIWEEHKDWYGIPSEGELLKEKAQYNQFCVCNTELLDFIAEELLFELMEGRWKHTDRLELAGFDTWGNACSCEKCKALGNSTDQHLHFIAYIRGKLNEAQKTNRLNRPVLLVMDTYEGTATLEPPENGIPDILKTSGDYIIHYPIIRCYKHKFDDPDCSYNSYYYNTLKAWKDIPAMVGEYYNVSKFEDLPILFTRTIPNDLRVYAKAGISGMTYMHLPILAWGVRAITQFLYARLAWDVDADEKKLIDEYFLCRYGSFAADAKKAYEYIETAWELCNSWRAWCQKSILTNLMNWDGKKPSAPLYYDDHFDYDMYDKGMESVESMKKALKIFEDIRMKDQENYLSTHVFKVSVPINPTDTSFGAQAPPLDKNLGEDIRGLEYGIDTMLIMSAFTKYHEQLLNDENTEKIWDIIENTAQRLDQYYMPITYTSRAAELTCYDAFTRTQLKPLYFRCKQYRMRGDKTL